MATTPDCFKYLHRLFVGGEQGASEFSFMYFVLYESTWNSCHIYEDECILKCISIYILCVAREYVLAAQGWGCTDVADGR